MKPHGVLGVGLLLLLCGALAERAWAAEAGGAPPAVFEVSAGDVAGAARRNRWFDCCRLPCWDFEAEVPLWIPGVSGTLATGDVSVDTDGPLGDAVDGLFDVQSELRFAFVGALGVKHRRWRLTFDGFGAKLGAGITFRLSDGTIVDGSMQAVIARGRLAYELGRFPFVLGGCPACFTWAPYVGARYYSTSLDFTLQRGRTVDSSENWWDPLVGVEMGLLWGRWGARGMADVGGFGVGSDLSWWASLEVEYRFNTWFSLFGGYSWLGVDFQDGSGPGRYVWDITLSGPVLGFRFRF